MCLIVTLSVTLPTPLKANAAEDNTSKYLYIIGTIAAYAGIDIDVDEVASRYPNMVGDVIELAKDIYDELADEYGWTNDPTSGGGGGGRHRDGIIAAAEDLEDYLDYVSSFLQPFNPAGIGVNYKFIFCLVRAIARWCDENIHSSSIPEGSTLGDVATVSGYVDFYTRGSFSFTFPTFSGSTMFVFPLNDCSVQYFFNPSYAQWDYWLLNSSISTSSSIKSGYYLMKIAPNNYDFSLVYGRSGSAEHFSGRTFLNEVWNPDYSSDGQYVFDFSMRRSDSNSFFLVFLSSSCYFVSGGNRYRLVGSRNSTFSFVNTYDSSDIYNDLVFATGFDALVWYYQSRSERE